MANPHGEAGSKGSGSSGQNQGDRGQTGRPGLSPAEKKRAAKDRQRAQAAKARAQAKAKRQRSRGVIWAKRILVGGLICGMAAAVLGLVGVIIAYNLVETPDPNREFTAELSQVYFRDGATALGDFAEQNRISLPYTEIPQSVKDAVVAAENRDFWSDPGISLTGILRAAKNMVTGGSIQSGSTITQQYIKLVYLTADQTTARKAKEILLAVKLTRSGAMSKEQILAGYLNAIWFGRGAYGVQAAAKAYFNIDAQDLSLPQSAALATILNSPGDFDPSVDEENAERFRRRYEYVLDGMVAIGAISADEADAVREPPEFPEVPTSDRYGGPNGFLLAMVERELVASGRFTEEDIQGDGLKIVTTFDQAAQDAAVASMQSWTTQAADISPTGDPGQLHGALASVEVGTGEVLALYGGPDYVASQWNWATTPRITGSTFKTYVLTAAIEDGFKLSTTLNGNTFTPTGDNVPIRNAGGAQYGQVTLARATASSINTAYVDLTQRMPDGAAKAAAAAVAAGVTRLDSWRIDNRIGLGSSEASPLDQATGYATLANNGAHVKTHVVREVWDDGERVYVAEPDVTPAFPAGVASTVTHALRGVITEGTGQSAASFPFPAAGKTGTGTRDVADSNNELTVSSWFVAYTRQVSTAVMFVRGDGMGDLDDYMGPGRSFPGSYSAGAWVDYMTVAMAGRDNLPFDEPVDKGPAEPASPSPSPSAAEASPTAEASHQPTGPSTPAEQPTTEPPPAEPSAAAPTESSATPLIAPQSAGPPG
ncbi:MAG: penicillin-binding protein, partial [Propionibacteriaceae bacterium]|nr:penicillin-binding protein [Propionibacteriaceae bacterium]